MAGFTVKHEMVTWLSKHVSDRHSIWQMPDGGRSDKFPKNITKEIMELVNAQR